MEKAKKILQQTAALKDKVNGFDSLVRKYRIYIPFIEMGKEGKIRNFTKKPKALKEEFEAEFEKLKISTLFRRRI